MLLVEMNKGNPERKIFFIVYIYKKQPVNQKLCGSVTGLDEERESGRKKIVYI